MQRMDQSAKKPKAVMLGIKALKRGGVGKRCLVTLKNSEKEREGFEPSYGYLKP